MGIRAFVCLLAASTWCASMPDATPPPPKGHSAQITIGCHIESLEVWRDADLNAVLEHETAAEWIDHVAAAAEGDRVEELDLDPHLSDHAGAITAPPVVDEDLPLQ